MDPCAAPCCDRYGSVHTRDPGNIYDTVKKMREADIKVSVVGAGAEVHVCSMIAKQTLAT